MEKTIVSWYLPSANPFWGIALLIEKGEAKLNDLQQINIASQKLWKKKRCLEISKGGVFSVPDTGSQRLT